MRHSLDTTKMIWKAIGMGLFSVVIYTIYIKLKFQNEVEEISEINPEIAGHFETNIPSFFSLSVSTLSFSAPYFLIALLWLVSEMLKKREVLNESASNIIFLCGTLLIVTTWVLLFVYTDFVTWGFS